MDTVLNHIRRHLNLPPEKKKDLNTLRNRQWSSLFERLMRNRLIMGALRYETFEEKVHVNHGYDLIGSAMQRLVLYQETGNMEHLVDVANLCMIEFECPSHKNPNWNVVDDGIHVEKTK